MELRRSAELPAFSLFSPLLSFVLAATPAPRSPAPSPRLLAGRFVLSDLEMELPCESAQFILLPVEPMAGNGAPAAGCGSPQLLRGHDVIMASGLARHAGGRGDDARGLDARSVEGRRKLEAVCMRQAANAGVAASARCATLSSTANMLRLSRSSGDPRAGGGRGARRGSAAAAPVAPRLDTRHG
jgi:hypothetical protein